MFDFKNYLTVAEAARAIGISESWLRRLIKLGRVPALRTPYGALVEAGALSAWVRQRQESENE